MIVAGIDEAGYGPVLGPLVVACCAIETPDCDTLPCFWKKLSRIVSRNRCKRGRKLHVNDSKLVYSTTLGLKELERAVLCLLEHTHGRAENLTGLLSQIDPQLPPHLPKYDWYADELDARYPIEVEEIAVRISSNALRIETERAQTKCVYYRAHVLLERQFNALCAKTKNKASASFTLVARHIDAMLNNFADRNLIIFCDRQGGREHYAELLRMMFEAWDLAIISEKDSRSEYRLTQNGRSVSLIFCEKAEKLALPVAAASMLAKYTREALMHRFNRYWQQKMPELTPTAGYHNDGWRFLRDIQDVRAKLGVRDRELIRDR